jgi:hypothetical protein
LNYTSLFLRGYVLMAAQGLGLGGVFMFGGESRFSGPAFHSLRDLTEWTTIPPHWVWGGVFMAYGFTLVFALGKSWAVHVLRGGLALYLFLALSFGGSAWNDERAAWSGLVSYSILAVVHLILSDHLSSRGWEG